MTLSPDKLNELVLGIDFHLRKLEEFVGSMKDIKQSLDALREAQEQKYLWELERMKIEFNYIKQELGKRGLPLAQEYEMSFTEIAKAIETPVWPEAVAPENICGPDNEQAAQDRANSILDVVVGEHLKGKKFLDFGCGQGHVVAEARKREAGLAVGYDIDISGVKVNSDWVTDHFDKIQSYAPFDIILLHDVLDHIKLIDPMEALRRVRSLLNRNGRVYVRNHPWSARHGGHLYEQKNKAFLHLIYDEVELLRLGGFVADYNIKVITPLETYKYWFDNTGFEVKLGIPTTTEVESFFFEPSFVRERLIRLWNNDELVMRSNMEINFVEYVLETKDLPNEIL